MPHLTAGDTVWFKGIPYKILADVEVETDKKEIDILNDTDDAVQKAQETLEWQK